MKKTIKKIWKCAYDAGYWTITHDGVEHAGYLAFLGLLSFFPFLIFFVAIAGVIGETQQSSELVKNIISILPEHVIAALKPRIDEILSGPPQGLLTIAIIGVIWTASSGVEGLRTILNRAYRVDTPPAYVWRRMMSVAQFLALTIVTIIGMTVLIVGPVVWEWVSGTLKLSEIAESVNVKTGAIAYFWPYVRYGFSASVVFLVLATIYFILPNIKQKLIAVMPGSFIAMVGWLLSAQLFTLYLKNFNQVNLVYGSLGGIIAALIFFYIVALILIYGAEFNYFFEKAIMGHKIIEKEKVRKKKRTGKKTKNA